MPILASRCQVAIKQEAVAGTAQTLAAADVVLTTDLPTFTPDVEIADRAALSAALSPRGVVTGARMAKIAFKMNLRGLATAAVDPTNLPDFSVPFRGCGIQLAVSGTTPNEITTFTPSSSLISDETTGAYCSLAIYRDGKQYLIHGAVGELSITWKRGAPTLAEFEFTGVYNAPTDVALLVPSYTTVVEPPFASAALTVLGFTTAKIDQLTLKLNNAITMRPYPNNASGFFTAQITGRRPTLSFAAEEELAATKNWWGEWIAGTTGSIATGTYPSTGSNYNQFSFTAPKAQYTGVKHDSRDGIAASTIEAVLQANSSAGDDEFSLVQT